MRGLLPATIAIVFQVIYLGLLKNVFLGVGAEGSKVEAAGIEKRSPWNNLAPRGTWHELVSRQTSTGNRTQDLYDFFTPDEPPSDCALECELIWGAVSACDLRSCVCTEQYGHEFERCTRCMAPNPTAKQIDYYQGILTEFQSNYCKNYRVPPLSFTATGANATSSGTGNTLLPLTTRTTSSIAMATGGGEGDVGYTASGGVLSSVPHVFVSMVLVGVVSLGLW